MQFHRYQVLRLVKLIETESKMVESLPIAMRGKNMKLLFNGYKVSIGEGEKFWIQMVMIVANKVSVFNGTKLYFKNS